MKQINCIILACLTFLLLACDKDTESVNFAPEVTTGSATDIFRKGATLSGSIRFNEESAAQEYGILVSEYQSMAEPTEYPITTGEAEYKVKVQNLSPDKTYYYCAYANSGYSTAKGEANSFHTTESNVPVFGELVIDSIGPASVRVSTTIIDDGGVTPIISGFCWREGNSGTPTLIDNVVNVSEVTGNQLTAVITGLSPLTEYVIAAYSVNAKGMGFGQGISVQTEKGPGIYSLEDLIAFRDARNANEDVSRWKTSDGVINVYEDIDLSSIENWEPISQILEDEVFDGNNHTISNVNISVDINVDLPGINTQFNVAGDYKHSYVGLISVNYGAISNLKIGQGIYRFTADDKGQFWSGSVCGANYKIIENCSSEVEIISNSGRNDCGGICGANYGEIRRCINRGNILLAQEGMISGGIAAQMGHATFVERPIIEDCANYGSVVVNDSINNHYAISGICGIAGGEKSLVNRCNNYGNISGGQAVGITSSAYEVTNCINYGNITGYNSSCGIVTSLDDDYILTNCVNKGNVSSRYHTAGIVCYIASDFIGTYKNNANEGTVNGIPGNETNSVAIDYRASN